MDFRTIFEQVPDDFDKWRPRYCNELFFDLIAYANLSSSSSVLEVGPGTGQATEPILKTGCSYTAIELGESFSEIMKRKFSSYKNFNIVNADFETYPFESERFDLYTQQQLFNGYPNILVTQKRIIY